MHLLLSLVFIVSFILSLSSFSLSHFRPRIKRHALNVSVAKATIDVKRRIVAMTTGDSVAVENQLRTTATTTAAAAAAAAAFGSVAATTTDDDGLKQLHIPRALAGELVCDQNYYTYTITFN